MGPDNADEPREGMSLLVEGTVLLPGDDADIGIVLRMCAIAEQGKKGRCGSWAAVMSYGSRAPAKGMYMHGAHIYIYICPQLQQCIED